MKFAGASIFNRRRSIFTTIKLNRHFSTSFSEHVSFIEDVAAISCPEHLPNLLNMLQKRGDLIMSPGDREGLFPLAIPLSRSTSGVTISLLRWPTATSGMDVPVVQVHKYGLSPLANNVYQFIQRMLVEEDASTPKGGNKELFHASDSAGMKLYRDGNFTKSQMPNVDTYLLRKVGVFPDVVERTINQYLEKGNHGWTLLGNQRGSQGRAEMKSPWCTLGYIYQEVAEIAKWKDEQIYDIKNKLTEQGKQDGLNRGKDLTQVLLLATGLLLALKFVHLTINYGHCFRGWH